MVAVAAEDINEQQRKERQWRRRDAQRRERHSQAVAATTAAGVALPSAAADAHGPTGADGASPREGNSSGDGGGGGDSGDRDSADVLTSGAEHLTASIDAFAADDGGADADAVWARHQQEVEAWRQRVRRSADECAAELRQHEEASVRRRRDCGCRARCDAIRRYGPSVPVAEPALLWRTERQSKEASHMVVREALVSMAPRLELDGKILLECPCG